MPQKTDAQLTTQAQIIRDETTELANTKQRVYDNLKDIIDSKLNNADVEAGAVDSVNGETGVVVLNAADIPNTPAGNIASTTVQAAINELDSEKQTAAQVASAVSAILATSITNGDTTHAPDGNSVFDALALKKDIVNSAGALTDASSIDLTASKHTLATSSATRTFTISYTGDDITVEVTLSASSATYTFPATSLCISEGIASGDNTAPLAGVSGDKYIIAIKKIGSAYYVIIKNFGQ